MANKLLGRSAIDGRIKPRRTAAAVRPADTFGVGWATHGPASHGGDGLRAPGAKSAANRSVTGLDRFEADMITPGSTRRM